MAFAEWIKSDLDFGDIITGSYRVIKLRFSHFLFIFLTTELVGSALSLFFIEKTVEWNTYLAITCSFVSTFLFSSLAGIMFILMVDGFATGKSKSFAEMLAVGIKLLPVVLVSSLIAGVFILLGTTLLILPGITVAVYLSFYMNAIVIRAKGPIDGLKYSFELVKGRWWMVFGVLFLVFILVFVISIAFELLSQRFDIKVISMLVKALLNSFIYVFVCVFFLHLESIKQETTDRLNA
ncbi:MAG TPA: hypothetical protein PLE67_03390 [Tenuifilaceae bacterium]|nr:hypothetical protein [Tenuifilaceae bacterium]HPQ32945.1 hypothetical protein [Tenuifilaceae bacterium]HRX66763.1 hypothetical protein [Tenuifilaceae bacterium]